MLRLPDIQSPMDIAALIWEKTTFYPAMIEDADAVRTLTHKVMKLLTAFVDEWFARYGSAFIAHYPDYYMENGLTLSEDEIGAVSEGIFCDLFLPELIELSNRYGALGMHCCAHARHQWPHWLKIPNLRLLNLVHSEETIREAYTYFAEHTAQMHSWCGEGDPACGPINIRRTRVSCSKQPSILAKMRSS